MENLETYSTKETQEAARVFARTLSAGTILCFSGDLGSGKTTFTQGILEELGAKRPYVSPTFLIMKEYTLPTPVSDIERVYHIDTYRIGSEDMKLIGWEEIIKDNNNIIIIEWPERIKDIIPPHATWIQFQWKGENTRAIRP